MQNGGLFLGRLCLSCKFKEETGESLTDVILKEKNGEGQRLLRYSDKPLTAIGSYLGFSFPSVWKPFSNPKALMQGFILTQRQNRNVIGQYGVRRNGNIRFPGAFDA